MFLHSVLPFAQWQNHTLLRIPETSQQIFPKHGLDTYIPHASALFQVLFAGLLYILAVEFFHYFLSFHFCHLQVASQHPPRVCSQFSIQTPHSLSVSFGIKINVSSFSKKPCDFYWHVHSSLVLFLQQGSPILFHSLVAGDGSVDIELSTGIWNPFKNQ